MTRNYISLQNTVFVLVKYLFDYNWLQNIKLIIEALTKIDQLSILFDHCDNTTKLA